MSNVQSHPLLLAPLLSPSSLLLGWWHFHCHMAGHLASGMGMLINEAPELQSHFPPPPGFPTCASFDDSPQLDSFVGESLQRYAELVL